MTQADAQLFNRFLSSITSPEGAQLPQSTLLGAVTHYLATSPTSWLPDLVRAVVELSGVEQPSSSTVLDIRHGLRESCREAVQAKLLHLDTRYEAARCAQRKKRNAARRWASTITNALGDFTNDTSRMYFINGMLKGMAEASSLDWGSSRAWMEEEAVLVIASARSHGDDPVLAELSYVIPHISAVSLTALDVNALAVTLSGMLRHQIRHATPQGPASLQLSRALAALISLCACGSVTAHEQWWPVVNQLYDDIRQGAADFHRPFKRRPTAPLLDIIVPPAHAVTTALLQTSDTDAGLTSRSSGRSSAAEEAGNLLLAFAALGQPTAHQANLRDEYEDIIDACTGIVARDRTGRAARELVRRLDIIHPAPVQVAFVLSRAAELIQLLDGRTIIDRVMTHVIHVTDTTHPAVFDAAHAFAVSFLRSCVESGTGPAQAACLQELVPFYAQLVVAQLRKGIVDVEKSKERFVVVVSAAAHLPEPHLLSALAHLDTGGAESADLERHLLFIRLACIPALPAARLIDQLEVCHRGILSLAAQHQSEGWKSLQESIGDISDAIRPAALRWMAQRARVRSSGLGLGAYVLARL